MIFGFGRNRAEEEEEQEEELELVLFQGALNGKDANLAANKRLVELALLRSKEMVSDALNRRAEMIRLDPKGKAAVVTIFIDGVPYAGERMPVQAGTAVTQMIKLLAGLDIKVRNKPQSGGIRAEFDEKPYELRVDAIPLKTGGERLLIRAQNTDEQLETPDDVGIPMELREKIRELSSNRQGVILAAGPPMSGVSTTAMAMMRCIDAYLYSIYNLADLGGRDLMHITNFERKPDDDLEQTIARAIRSEADVLFVDPLRDVEMARTIFGMADKVCFASEIKAPDAASAILQLNKWLGDPKLTAARLQMVVSSKLIRKLCKDCKQAFRPNPKLVQKVGLPPETSVLYRTPQPVEVDGKIEEPDPCRFCGGIGYYGRTAMFEVIEMTDSVRKIVAAGGDAAAIKQQARKEKMSSLRSEGLRLVAEGVTSLEELQRAFKAG